VSFVKLSSYQGTSTTGIVRELVGLTTSLKGKCVVVVEDIVDTGITLEKLMPLFKNMTLNAFLWPHSSLSLIVTKKQSN